MQEKVGMCEEPWDAGGRGVHGILGCRQGECPWNVGVQERWGCVRDLGMQMGKMSMECWGAHVGRCPWNVGVQMWGEVSMECRGARGSRDREGAGQSPRCPPPNPRWLWGCPAAPGSCAKVTAPVLLSGLGDVIPVAPVPRWHPWSWDQEFPGQLFPPGALGSQLEREGLPGWVSGFGGVRVLERSCPADFGAADARARLGKASQCLQSVGIILKDNSWLCPAGLLPWGLQKKRESRGKPNCLCEWRG